MNDRPDEAVLQARYAAARAQFERNRAQQAGEGAALGVVFEGYADMMAGSRLMQRGAHLAQLFVIAFAFIVPNLLMIFVIM